MPGIADPDRLDAQREIIRLSLDAITDDIGIALRDADLKFPIFITVPASGDAVETLATPLDPTRTRLVTRTGNCVPDDPADDPQWQIARDGMRGYEHGDDRCRRDRQVNQPRPTIPDRIFHQVGHPSSRRPPARYLVKVGFAPHITI
jgi:hypothetical protein